MAVPKVTLKASKSSSNLLVAAIDFGTTYSGWAFSFRHEFEADPIKVSARTWPGGTLVSSKAPTCALIKPDGKTLHSFGYEAESKYGELALDGDHKEWFFFKRFKMMLHDKLSLSRDMDIEDEGGKKFSAMKVFSICIAYLKRDLLDMSEKRISGGGLKEGDIHWVLTVPAIWNDSAKQFMREAAESKEKFIFEDDNQPLMAAIPSDKLTIALEPEAASLYCRHLPVEKCVKGTSADSLASFKAGTKYIVLDAGGGTVDVTVHEVLKDKSLKELHKASGGAWGGTKVDEAFRQMLEDIVGKLVMTRFQDEHVESYIDMFRSFEIKKRSISPTSDGKITFSIPIDLVNMCKTVTGRTLPEVISKSKYATKVMNTSDKLRVDADCMQLLFDPTVKSIINHIAGLLDMPETNGCSTIVMVGGFSESPMLHHRIRSRFPKIKLIIPQEAGLAIMKGAVIFGHRPTAIAERVCKFTYGKGGVHKTEKGCKLLHPPGKTKLYEDGIERCQNIFAKFVEIGQTVKIGEEQKEIISRPVTDDQKCVDMEIFASSNPNPNFVTDPGCHLIGSFKVPLLNKKGGKDREMGTSMKFGGTEIEVKVVEKANGNVTIKRVDFLG